jgi:hypothetical protein
MNDSSPTFHTKVPPCLATESLKRERIFISESSGFKGLTAEKRYRKMGQDFPMFPFHRPGKKARKASIAND